MTDLITLGWRERLALPHLGIDMLKAKLDTGARSSSLHVDALEAFERNGATWLRFSMTVGRRLHPRSVRCEARALDRRVVTDTGGRGTERWFVRTDVRLAGLCYPIEISLTDRRHMLFPMLLGRSALLGRFAVDPSLSYTQPRPHPAYAEPVARVANEHHYGPLP
ncbi:ATP-dependent zinc protease family protein [Frateuria soli]|uniref:ATP-dependent zinc protease family protein n=1 Tax=Frateuria soli TaxID=1542730 RepID=UPI001E47DFBA|nr:RimK/LysX family protein [Frateuria soli]UGB38536.1 RimK/LysX family protein [Frateuria soli]